MSHRVVQQNDKMHSRHIGLHLKLHILKIFEKLTNFGSGKVGELSERLFEMNLMTLPCLLNSHLLVLLFVLLHCCNALEELISKLQSILCE